METIKQEQSPMDNAELLKQLIAEQQRTNELLEWQKSDRERQIMNAQRVVIAEREGVDPSQIVMGGDGVYAIARSRPMGRTQRMEGSVNGSV